MHARLAGERFADSGWIFDLAGNAKIAGLEKDLGLSGYDYNTLLSVFYVSYVSCRGPTYNLICLAISHRPLLYTRSHLNFPQVCSPNGRHQRQVNDRVSLS